MIVCTPEVERSWCHTASYTCAVAAIAAFNGEDISWLPQAVEEALRLESRRRRRTRSWSQARVATGRPRKRPSSSCAKARRSPAEAHHTEQLLHGHLAAIDDSTRAFVLEGEGVVAERAHDAVTALETLGCETTLVPTRHPVVDIVRFHLLTLAVAEARGIDPDPIRRSRARCGPRRPASRTRTRGLRDPSVTQLADVGVVEAIALLAARETSSRELAESCLARIDERDGTRSHAGDPASINAWVRVYEEDALAAADRADARLAAGDAPQLCGVPIGLKDLYAVAGKPLTASSRLLDEVPERSCAAWERLEAAGMVLLGHLHTHEFAAGGTTDQTGNPWSLDRSPGGSSGGSGAALAARMTPAASGTDTAGSQRIPSAICGTSTIKPTRGSVPTRGIVPLAPTFDHAGPMARSLADCEPLLAVLAGANPPAQRVSLRRLAVSPRLGLVELDPDVAEGFEAALSECRNFGIEVVEVPGPDIELDLGLVFLDLVCAEMLAYHRRFDDRRELYRPSIRGFIDYESAAPCRRRRTSLRRSGASRRRTGGSTGSPSTGSMRCSSRRCRSWRACAATATTRRSRTSPRSPSRITGTGRASRSRRCRRVWAGAAACRWGCR